MSKVYNKRLIQYNEYRDIFAQHECELLTTFDELLNIITHTVTRTNIIYKATCGHNNTINIKTFITNPINWKICNNCVTYNRCVKLFSDRKCKLLYSMEEFAPLINNDTWLAHVVLKYEATCYHENEITFVAFDRGYGDLCKECTLIKMKSATGENRTSRMEDRGIVYLKQLFKNLFEIKTTDDGCLADFALKNINSKEDIWLNVQLKTTTKSTKYGYIFKFCGRKYNNCVIICLCEKDEKLWILNGNDIPIIDCIYINKNKNNVCMYPIEEITKDNIINPIVKYYGILHMSTFDEMNTPTAIKMKKEQEFRKYRDVKCNFITFLYPEETAMVYDFKIGDLKVQEKIAHESYHNIIFALERSWKKRRLYKKGDNDIYWIHSICKNYFFVIPEEFLIREGNIDTDDQKGSATVSISKQDVLEKNHKYNKYFFNYNDVDREKLLKLIIEVNNKKLGTTQSVIDKNLSEMISTIDLNTLNSLYKEEDEEEE